MKSHQIHGQSIAVVVGILFSGEWDYQPSPSNRDAKYKVEHTFTLDMALSIAEKLAPEIIINGKRATEFLRVPLPDGLEGEKG